MKCKCGANLYRISGLTRYDRRDGIREAAWCDSCYTLFSSHAFGLSEIGKLTDTNKIDQLRARNAELEAEVMRLRKALRLAINKFDDEGYHCIADTLKAALEASDET